MIFHQVGLRRIILVVSRWMTNHCMPSTCIPIGIAISLHCWCGENDLARDGILCVHIDVRKRMVVWLLRFRLVEPQPRQGGEIVNASKMVGRMLCSSTLLTPLKLRWMPLYPRSIDRRPRTERDEMMMIRGDRMWEEPWFVLIPTKENCVWTENLRSKSTIGCYSFYGVKTVK